MSDFENIRYEVENGRARITLNPGSISFDTAFRCRIAAIDKQSMVFR